MKLIKLASLAVAAAGTIGIFSAGSTAQAAPIGVSTNNTALNVSIIMTTNAPSKKNGNVYTYTTKTVKYTNKQLLTLFQNWSTNAFSTTGAKIVIGWNSPWYGDVLVVDKTGTNVLFDASSPGGSGHYFYVTFDDQSGSYTEKYNDSVPGSDTWTEAYGAYYELYDNDYYLPYTYLYGYGSGLTTFTQNWDKNDNYSTWKLNAKGMFPNYGDQYLFDEFGSASATITSSGSGKGLNQYWY